MRWQGFFSSFVVQLLGSALFADRRSGRRVLGGCAARPDLYGVRLAGIGAVGRVRQFGTPHWKQDRQHSAAFYGYVGEVLTATEDIRSSGAEGQHPAALFSSTCVIGGLPGSRRMCGDRH